MEAASACGNGSANGQSADHEFPSLPRKQLLLALAGIMLAMFVSVLGQTVIVTAMPQVILDLGGFDRYTWGSTAYLLAAITVTPITGRLTDIYGPKIFFLVGGTIFILGAIPAGFSQSMTQLIIFRGLQGIGGGIIMISCFVAIAVLLPPNRRARPQGLMSAVLAVAWVIGPPVGGAISEGMSWRWVFWLNVPVGVAIFALIISTFPRITSAVENRRMDYPGMLTFTAAIGLLILGLSLGGAYHAWGSPLIIALLVFGVAMTLAFAVTEISSDAPIMPLGMYRISTVAAGAVVSLITGFGLYATILFTPLALQAILHVSPVGSGGLLTPMLLGVILGAVLSSQTLSRTGERYRAHAVISAGFMVAGLYLISTMRDDTALALVSVFVALFGIGAGGMLAAMTVAVQNTVPHRVLGAATATLHFYRQMGGVLGLAVLGALLTQRFSSRLDKIIPDPVTAAVPSSQLDAVKNNPHALIDPAAVETLSVGSDSGYIEEMLHTALHDALVGALKDVFIITAAAVALCLLAALFIRASGDRGSIGAPPVPNEASPRRARFRFQPLAPARAIVQILLRLRISLQRMRDNPRR